MAFINDTPKPCYKCGYCCTKSPCAYGRWNSDKKQCEYLTNKNLCEIYEVIMNDPNQKWNPAFGYGCCMPLFNTLREAKIKQSKEEINMLNSEIMERFIENWEYLNELEIVHYRGISQFAKCLSVEVVKVNPDTMAIDDNEELNTKVQVWVEFGGVNYNEDLKTTIAIHDYDLDCGADTFEEAIIELGRLCKGKGYKTSEYEEITDSDIEKFKESLNNQ